MEHTRLTDTSAISSDGSLETGSYAVIYGPFSGCFTEQLTGQTKLRGSKFKGDMVMLNNIDFSMANIYIYIYITNIY